MFYLCFKGSNPPLVYRNVCTCFTTDTRFRGATLCQTTPPMLYRKVCTYFTHVTRHQSATLTLPAYEAGICFTYISRVLTHT